MYVLGVAILLILLFYHGMFLLGITIQAWRIQVMRLEFISGICIQVMVLEFISGIVYLYLGHGTCIYFRCIIIIFGSWYLYSIFNHVESRGQLCLTVRVI
jgi:hypothetical protein